MDSLFSVVKDFTHVDRHAALRQALLPHSTSDRDAADIELLLSNIRRHSSDAGAPHSASALVDYRDLQQQNEFAAIKRSLEEDSHRLKTEIEAARRLLQQHHQLRP